jgi:Domain of unknown function (DUF4397)
MRLAQKLRLVRNALWLVVALAVVVPIGLLRAAPARASAGEGWVRLAHLSPDTPAVDVYLYSFGDPSARLVLHHVGYGTVSPYEELPTGDYTVSMRAAGAPASAQPVLSTGFAVGTGDAYTVAGMGPVSGLRLQVLKDTLAATKGQAMVRVIQASMRQNVVTMSLGGQVLAQKLPFAATTAYQTVPAGTGTARVTGGSENASQAVSLPADTIHTLVVLDGASGLRIDDLVDAAGSQVMPSGGAATGLGGTAPRPVSSPLPWLALIGAGVLLLAATAWRYRRIRLGGSRTP